MCPIKFLFALSALFAIFSISVEATKKCPSHINKWACKWKGWKSFKECKEACDPKVKTFEVVGCGNCPHGWKLIGDECVKKTDFHKQGFSEKHISFKGFDSAIRLEVDAKIKSINHKDGKVRLGLEEKGVKHGFVEEWVRVDEGETEMVNSLLVVAHLAPKDYDFEARQYNAKSWVTLRVQCKVEKTPVPTTVPPLSTCPPVPTCEVCPTLPPMETCPVCPTPEPTTPPPTCPPNEETICEDFVGTMPLTCDGTQTKHGLWLGQMGPAPIISELWRGPQPLVTPADFQQDGTNATLTGVVTDGTSFWKYEFQLTGLFKGNPGDGYFQDLLSGCSMPDDSEWSYYNDFTGTLMNLQTGKLYKMTDRSNGLHKPQIGNSASLFDTEYGISFWFEIVNDDGSLSGVIGDVNLSLRCVSKV